MDVARTKKDFEFQIAKAQWLNFQEEKIKIKNRGIVEKGPVTWHHGYKSEPGARYHGPKKNKNEEKDVLKNNRNIAENWAREERINDKKRIQKCEKLLKLERENKAEVMKKAKKFQNNFWIEELLVDKEKSEDESIQNLTSDIVLDDTVFQTVDESESTGIQSNKASKIGPNSEQIS